MTPLVAAGLAFRNRSGRHVVVVRVDGAGGPVSVTRLIVYQVPHA
jgi:hypothetical protein